MKTSFNSVKLSGRAGSDLKITKLKTKGKKIGRVGIAYTNYYKNKDLQLVENTYWFNLIFWNGKADEAKDLIKKGTHFTIEGHLTSTTYKDKQDQTRYSTDIVVEKFTVEKSEK